MKPINAINCIDKYLFMGITLVSLALASCSPEPTPILTSEMPTHTPVSPTATGLTGPTQQPPASTATPVPECPSPTEGTQLMRNERYGYCLLVPAGYVWDEPDLGACIVTEDFVFWGSLCPLGIEISDAAGRTTDEVADERLSQLPFDPGRSSLTIAGEEAVVFADVGGQVSKREVLIVHDDRMYALVFPLPDPSDGSAVEQFERLYSTVTDSFSFVPLAESPASVEPAQPGGGSAVVAYIQDGDVVVWEEATRQSQTLFDSGDVIRVELSDDGQLVAFVRRTLLGRDPRYGRSSLWVVERDGGNPRELVSDSQLRARLGATDDDDIGFPALMWIPNGHRLLYNVTFFPPYLWEQGLYLVDADTLGSAELVPVEEVTDFAPSPDGERIAVATSTNLFFVLVDDSLAGDVGSTYPAGEVPGVGPYSSMGEVSSLRGWTQDSFAILVRRGNTIWRVPVDGGAAQSLITLRGDNEELAPDGSTVTFVRRGAQSGGRRFVVPLPKDVGPLAVVPDPVGLSWSPGGTPFVIDRDVMTPLCAYAAQAIEVCGPPFNFGEPIRSVEWIDRERFLYVTSLPNQLVLGSLDGTATVIAEDPQAPTNASAGTIAMGFAAVASTCSDDSEFVSDVTVPDGTRFAPETLFQKTWRVRNTGDCTWDASYRLTFLSGDRMSGPRSAPLGEPVQPGEEVDLSVILVAPAESGTYQGQWQMFAPDGTPFGTRSYLVIQVP